jgi:hypothetical protein
LGNFAFLDRFNTPLKSRYGAYNETGGGIEEMKKYLSKATNYLEYGSGGSTKYVKKFNNIKKIKSIESDKKFSEKIRLECPYANVKYVDIGRTREFGNPVDRISINKWPDYSNNYSDEFDVVLIDGRFRVACLLDILRKKGSPTIIFHDFNNRPKYHIIKQFVDIIDSADSLVVLKVKQDLSLEKIHELYNTYKFIYD